MKRYVIIKTFTRLKISNDYGFEQDFHSYDYPIAGLVFNICDCRFVCLAESAYDALVLFSSEIERRANIPKIVEPEGMKWEVFDNRGPRYKG